MSQFDCSLVPRNRGQNGFSLLELLIVVALMLVLFVLYWSRGSASYQTKQKTACKQNLQTVYVALQNYATQNQDRFPSILGSKSSEAPLSLLIPKYTSRTEAFICPGSKDKSIPPAEPFSDRKISYAYCMGLTAQAGAEQWLMADALIDASPHAKGTLIFSPDGHKPADNHDKYGGVLLFADGHAEITEPKTEFPIVIPKGTTILNPSR